MKCPLSNWYREPTEDGGVAYCDDCLKAECAWWGKLKNDCAVLSIAASLYGIGEKLQQRTTIINERRRS